MKNKQWFRSRKTERLIPESSQIMYDLIEGEGAFELLIQNEDLIPIESPSVIDILLNNGSTAQAAARYREIHPEADAHTTLEMVRAMQKDIKKIGGVG